MIKAGKPPPKQQEHSSKGNENAEKPCLSFYTMTQKHRTNENVDQFYVIANLKIIFAPFKIKSQKTF